MPSLKDLTILSALLLQAFPIGAAPAPADSYRALADHTPLRLSNIKPCHWHEDCGNGDEGHWEGNDKDESGHGRDHGDDDGNGVGREPTSSITDCPDISTTTITITTDNTDGIATATITSTTTVTKTATETDGGTGDLKPTETDTVIETITDCTATTTDYTTVTADASTITTTITAAGPTVTSTTTTTEGAETVTEPGVTTTETLVITDTETVTDTTTLTNHQIETETTTQTETHTVTLNHTITSTSTTTSISTITITTETCSTTSGISPDPTPDPEPGVYGTCTDPTINYVPSADVPGAYIYTTNNQKDFPFNESPTIQSPAALICNRLESPCNAPAETVALCRETIDAVAGLEGQAAADAWNAALLSIVG
ncbi:hypothetical protein BJY01DRAFT_242299 [Aspergillus pseudoustus]|uniref:Uncharacterized protein n=1 Tax=Aspergillus pseudoustus TaxID=1810923 RepID=A0ABR4KY87_9EURO